MIDLHTHLDAEKHLVVTQTLINQTDDFVSFDCLLFAPNRRRQRIQVYNLGRGRNTQNYYLPQGDELIGEKLWIRAEEVGGQRMLNYHIAVEP